MACACPATNSFAGASRPSPPTVGADGIHVGGTLRFPHAFDSRKSYPLAVVLHGRTDTGTNLLTEMALTELHNMDSGVIVWAPTGATDTAGPSAPATAWDACVACCWFDGSPSDDVAYIAAGIQTIRGLYSIDSSRIWLIGHSTGAFLANSVAAEHADVVTGIIVMNGYADNAGAITPSQPVHVHIFTATADTLVLPGGSVSPSAPEVPDNPYIGALDLAAAWHAANGGSSSLGAAGAAFAMDSADPTGSESTTQAYTVQATNGKVWVTTMTGSTHLPTMTGASRAVARDTFMGALRQMQRV
jgi:poly(3-hydroxybutyrate) depolymerase